MRHVAQVARMAQARMHDFGQHLPFQRPAMPHQAVQQFVGFLRLVEVHVGQHVAHLVRRVRVQRPGLVARAHVVEIALESQLQRICRQQVLLAGRIQRDRNAGRIAVAEIGGGGNEVGCLSTPSSRGSRPPPTSRSAAYCSRAHLAVSASPERFGEPGAVVPALQRPVVVPVTVGRTGIAFVADRRRDDAAEAFRRGLVGLVARHHRALAQFLQELIAQLHLRPGSRARCPGPPS